MAFTFATFPAPPPESPIEKRQKPTLAWFDSAVTIDTWLVEVYLLLPDKTTSTLILEAYVAPENTSNNRAIIDLSEWTRKVENAVFFEPYVSFQTGGYVATPSLTELATMNLVAGYQLQIYSVTNGVKSVVQGTRNFLLMPFAKKQQWNWTGYESIFDYYPDFGNKKGWLTDREVQENTYIRYDMAVEDEGVVNALYLGNYDYEYETGENTNNANWDQVRYQVFYNNIPQNVLILDKAADVNGFYAAGQVIPIGPANINDNANWIISYDLTTQPWDYIKIELIETSASKCREIRVYPDCRPQKHTPAQLYWMGTKGVEFLRFDGRVNDVYDVSGRESFAVNNFFNSTYGGSEQSMRYVPITYQQPSEGKRGFTLSEDFFTQAERELFKTALTATHMMVRYEDTWYPCTLKTTNYTHQQPSSRLQPIRLEVEIAQPLSC